MLKYYKQLNESGEIMLLLAYDFIPKITNPLILEITRQEYEYLNEKL